MPIRSISELLDRALIIVAHADDECIGAGALLQRMRDPAVVFCTDGGPRDAYFWQRYGSREEYVRIRREEAARAGAVVGLKRQVFLPIVDQELYLNLGIAFEGLETAALKFQSQAVLTLAYEGGHPDHDCCSFLSHVIAKAHNLPVWEMPLYHRTSHGSKHQQFVEGTDETQRLQITAGELAKKRKMVEEYASQAEVLEGFNLDLELFRPQLNYNFLRPPKTDVINYEEWQWRISAKELCRAFSACPGGTAANLSHITGGQA